MDDILGELDSNGSPVRWPKLAVGGAIYSPPSTRVQVSPTAFVVILPGFTDWDTIDDIKVKLGKPAPMVKPKPLDKVSE